MLKIFEMFAGYGGASFALKKAEIPFECVGYSEIKETAIKTYNINHPGIKNFGDCTKINPEEIPDFDIIFAGFPCQDVSTAGKNDLSLGRTILIDEVFKIVKVKNPKFIFLENVKGLTSKLHNEFFSYIENSLCNLGYKIYHKILNSRDYNTPQNRERIYFVCIRNDIKCDFQFPKKEIYVNDWHNYIDDEKNLKELPQTNSYNSIRTKEKNITEIKYVTCLNASSYSGYMCGGIIDFKSYFRVLTSKERFRMQGFFNDEIKIDHLSETNASNLAGDGWDINIISKILKCIPFNDYTFKNKDERKIINNQMHFL